METKSETIHTRIPVNTLELIDLYASENKFNRSRAIRKIFDMFFHDINKINQKTKIRELPIIKLAGL